MLLKKRLAVPEGKISAGHVRVAQAVQDVGDGAVAARDDDAIEGADVGDRILRLHAVSDEAHADLVAAHREGAREREDSSELGPDARLWMMRMRSVFPFVQSRV